MYRSSTAKCTALWTKSSRSSKRASDSRVPPHNCSCSRALPVCPPHPTAKVRWTFTFEAEPEVTYSAENEVMDYLRSAYDLQILHQFSNMKNIFLKYNTPTPSSAPVERLFSLGGLVLTPRRNRLSDKRFEKLLLMRYNHWFTRPTPLFHS